MVNRITNTPLFVNVYCSRGLVANHFVTKNCVRQADGTLWAVVADWSSELFLLKSTDNGFSWSIARENVQTQLSLRDHAGLNADGVFAYIMIDERYRLLDVYMGVDDNVGPTYAIDRGRYDLDDVTGTAPTEEEVETDVHHGQFDMCHNHEQVFLTYVQVDGDLAVTRCSPRSTSVANPDVQADGGTSFWNFLSTVCTKDGIVHIVVGRANAPDSVEYWQYDSADGSFTGPVTVKALDSNDSIPRDISLAIDSYGTLACVFTDQINGSAQAKLYYATSTDTGTTWSVTQISPTSGHTVYQDNITSDYVNRGNIIGSSQGGFMLSYVDKNASGVAKTYVRQLTTSDGSTYTLGAEKEIATGQTASTDKVVGLRWFHPTDIKLLDLSDPGLVRYAYQVGEGNGTANFDTVAVSFFQELGYESPFPTSLSSETGSHTLDSTGVSGAIRVLMDIHAGPEGNIDFYAAGFTGGFTERYEAAFNRIGTNVRILKYEPDSDNYLSDITAYGAPTEYQSKALFDPVTYSFPSPQALDTSDTVAYIEQDVRKMHLPPDFHLARTFLVNKGGYLKRTVWLVEYMDNQYEISQVIPRFINNQICFYEANAYVVGPSRDPFSRTVLPSES